MPSERAIVDAYTRRALLLLRVGRGLGRDAGAELRQLAKALRAILGDAAVSTLGRRELAALLREVEAAIAGRYAAIAEQQASELLTLAEVEARWAAPDRRAGAAPAGLLVLGLPLARHWQRQAEGLTDRITAAVRSAATTGQEPSVLLAAIIGQGPRGRERGGLMEGARQQAATLADTSAHAAAYAARQKAWESSGVRYLKWHAILDPRTTIGCAVRAGLIYTTDFQPVNHDIPIDQPPPRHFNCRSLLAPMSPDFEPPGDGQDTYSENLNDWLKRQPEIMQDELLGATRAALWRAGKLDSRGLLGRDGAVLSVAELGRILPDDAKVMLWTGEANYKRLASELTPAVREAGAAYGLAEHHMVAIRHYSGTGYEALNEALRAGRVGRSTVSADVLNEALDRLPAYTGTVVRRATLPDDVLARYMPGNVVTEDAFTSATRGVKDVFDHRPHRLVIRGLSGKDISAWSRYSRDEQEVLFGAPRKFYVKTRTDKGSYIEIELEELS